MGNDERTVKEVSLALARDIMVIGAHPFIEFPQAWTPPTRSARDSDIPQKVRNYKIKVAPADTHGKGRSDCSRRDNGVFMV